MTIDFKVTFKGKVIPLNSWDPMATIADLKQYLESETKLPIDCQKLLWKGRVLRNDQSLEAIGLSANTKIILMGSQMKEVEAIEQMDKRLIERQSFAPRLSARMVSARKPVRRQPLPDKYTFHRITVLEEFPESESARRLLERLRDDRGIRAIMQQRQWSVGELTELTPFETGILGYNRNQGQLIAIRLRTNDLSGFRHYDSIRKVLLHELTHNVWSEHDDRFHALNRQLNKDVVALDWTAHGGHRLSGGVYYDPSTEAVAVAWEGGAYRLGGLNMSSQHPETRRQLAAGAAMSRLTKQEEQELDEGCGSSKA
ncbi:hypothetical protein EC973_009612 [Apophysomyces ossiformis]|uniref:WLM-domain-containing protein n=1 Tax=Apophysomyces ossiformis TaxID=679940 RepID=A0A8H7BVE8_9FUNG|nr:hypothetical protein EC973_009612 [Apophysomyces ossiformis]